MDHRLIEGLMEVVVPAVKDYVGSEIPKATQPLLSQIEELKSLAKEIGGKLEEVEKEAAKTAEKVDALHSEESSNPLGSSEKIQELIAPIARLAAAEEVAKIPVATNGEDADPEVTAALVAQKLDEALAARPVPQDGKDGAPGLDGKDADPELVTALVGKKLDEALAARPVPQDGKDGAPGLDGKDADPELVTALVDKKLDEALTARPVPQDGKDGAPGLDGKDADPELIQHMIKEQFSALPTPRDGKDADPREVLALLVPEIEKLIAPDDVAHQVAKSIQLLAESPPIVAKVTTPIERSRSKTITTRRDKDNNLVADVVEHA